MGSIGCFADGAYFLILFNVLKINDMTRNMLYVLKNI
jgi:hypothetical protein